MKRQGLLVTREILEYVYEMIVADDTKFLRETNIEDLPKESLDKWKHILPIVNRTPECSDTWEFEI